MEKGGDVEREGHEPVNNASGQAGWGGSVILAVSETGGTRMSGM